MEHPIIKKFDNHHYRINIGPKTYHLHRSRSFKSQGTYYSYNLVVVYFTAKGLRRERRISSGPTMDEMKKLVEWV